MDKTDRNPQRAFRAASDPVEVSGTMTTIVVGQLPRDGEKPPRTSRMDGAEAGVVRGLVYASYVPKRG